MAKELVEKVAYLRGLIEGMGIGRDDKHGRVIQQMADILSDMARALEEITDRQVETEGRIESIDEDLAAVEEDLYDVDDEEYVDIECPHCKETICFDEDLLEGDDELCCPSCGGVIFSSENDEEGNGEDRNDDDSGESRSD
ncbi:MAG: hypothetical protein HPY55_09395 [Firmicutes bacterium]|nr:hypothetical protein [Bacillota bacterium]